MKYLIIGGLILALLIAGCVISGREIKGWTEAVAAPLEEALASVRAGEYENCRSWLSNAAREWQLREDALASLLSHGYTLEIGDALTEAQAVRQEDLERCCVRLLRSVRELAEMERVVLSNVF